MSPQSRFTPPQGFVIALRATLLDLFGTARQEWLIASRWGPDGRFLSIARTLVGASSTAVAPQHLIPRWSTLALLAACNVETTAPRFTFATQCPSGLTLSGRFAPAHGEVHLHGSDDASIGLQGNARCLPGRSPRAFQFIGVRVGWIGEFVERGDES
jgi:hypothetical protein